jgi:hypothetical protein
LPLLNTMAAIYMQHPEHGSKVAVVEQEAEADEQNGWVRYNPDTASSHSDDLVSVVPVNDLDVKRRRRRSE